MRRLSSCFSFAVLLAGSTSAGAQQPQPQPEGGEIVVTGTRDTDRQVSDFVGALASASPRGQLARFEEAVCPLAFGVGPAQKSAIEGRLRQVAGAAGIPLGKPGCAPNALVMVTGAKRPFLEALLRQRPDYFASLSGPAVRRLVRAPGPTAAWQLEGQVNSRGVPIVADGGEVPINRTIDNPSRITAAARPVFGAAALVVESGALDGLTTTQLADYAAMRLFARTEPKRLAGSTAPTILNVIDAPMGSEVPITLTEWDLGFLRGLYAGPANLYAGSQRSGIKKQIRRDLEKAETEDLPAQKGSREPR